MAADRSPAPRRWHEVGKTRIGASVRTLGIVRRLTGCYYCGRPMRGRAEVCGFCSDLPLRDPLVAKARKPLSEAERIEASR